MENIAIVVTPLVVLLLTYSNGYSLPAISHCFHSSISCRLLPVIIVMDPLLMGSTCGSHGQDQNR